MRNVARFLGLASALIMIGCSKRAPLDPVLPSTEVSEFVEHRVSYAGETLGSIAQWYTGSQKQWTAIQRANPELKPNKLRVGNVVRIPRELVRRTEMMPKPRGKALSAAPHVASAPSSPSQAPYEDTTNSVVAVNDSSNSAQDNSATAPAPTVDKGAGLIAAYEEAARAKLTDSAPPQVPAESNGTSEVSALGDPPAQVAGQEPEVDLSAVPETAVSEDDSGTKNSDGSFLSALGKALAPPKKTE
jgi:hypothetical protein